MELVAYVGTLVCRTGTGDIVVESALRLLNTHRVFGRAVRELAFDTITCGHKASHGLKELESFLGSCAGARDAVCVTSFVMTQSRTTIRSHGTTPISSICVTA